MPPIQGFAGPDTSLNRIAQITCVRTVERTMPKYVLAADYTLMTDVRNVPLATFFSCIPTDYWPSRLVFRILANPPKLDVDGRPIRVPYGLRKIEASLVRAYARAQGAGPHPRGVG